MSLRLKLTLMLGSAFVVLWTLAATWMLYDLRNQMMRSLDERLAASARMVAGLLVQFPTPQSGDGIRQPISAEQLGIPDGLACQVSSLRGEVLARSHSVPDQQLDAESVGYQDQLIEGKTWRSFTLLEGELRITTADRLDERVKLEHSVLLAAAVPVLVALLGSLGVLWFGLGRGLAPLRRIREALTRRNADSLEPLQIKALPAELLPLVETQNQLLMRIAQALERERRFTGDAAHELRSPLTAIKTHLQVARMTQGDDVVHALANAEAGADRLQRILEQLLLLARVEGCQDFDDGTTYPTSLPQKRAVSAVQIARMAIADACPQGSSRIELDIDEGMVDAPLRIPAVLATLALRNLLENALKHAPAHSRVRLSLKQIGARACYSVHDQGQGIAAEQLAEMTRRFRRSTQSTGSGLGLSIVKAIAERFGCELRFTQQADGFEVTLAVDFVPSGINA